MRTPITYYGGKQTMCNEIIPMIPDHKIYCEPFFGGGAVFFSKTPSYLEVINDINDRLITFYTVMKNNFYQLNELIQDTLHSESLHLKAREVFYGRIKSTELEIAWSVWVLTNMSFAGSIYGGWKWDNGSKGSHFGRTTKNKRQYFIQLKERLQEVQISKNEALSVIKKRDTKETFYYLDPPYPGSYQGHYRGYSMLEFSLLLNTLNSIKGKFILSNFWSQTLKYHIIKNGWHFKKITKVKNVANLGGSVQYKEEILVWNYNVKNSSIDSIQTTLAFANQF
jgi:DNA adenine methylase